MGTFFVSDNYHILDQEINALHTEEQIENTQYIDSLSEDYDIEQNQHYPNLLAQKILMKMNT